MIEGNYREEDRYPDGGMALMTESAVIKKIQVHSSKFLKSV
jgi:hypothetical protein